jgi:hypothetical protein
MACRYYFDGNFLTETEFKKVLHDGLLDQLVANNNFDIPGFEVNDELAIQIEPAELSYGPIKSPLLRKINTRLNQEQRPESGEWVKKNPSQVIKEANKQIETSNKKLKQKRKPVEFLLVSKTKDKLKIGGASKQVLSSINESDIFESILDNMEEGFMYMLVPSAYGLYPVRLYSAFAGETKQANNIVEQLTEIFEAENSKEVLDTITNVKKYFHNFEISKTKTGIKTQITKKEDGKEVNEEITHKSLPALIEYVLGTHDTEGNYTGEIVNGKKLTPGLLAKVDYSQINKPGVNEKYANEGFIATDLYTEDGNFFNSSSFVIKALQLSAESDKELVSILKEHKESIGPKARAKEEVSTPVENENTKQDESPFHNVPIHDQDALPLEELLKQVRDTEPDLGDAHAQIEKEVAPEASEDAPDISDIPGVKGVDAFKKRNIKKKSGEDLDFGDAKTKTVDAGVDGTKWDKKKELAWLKKKIGDNLVGTVFDSIEDLNKYLPKETYELLLEARKQGRSLHGLFTSAAIYLNENAFTGTAYHEAFHVIFNMALTPEKRVQLYKEAADKFKDELGDNPTLLEIEELLADKFMEFVQSNERTSNTLGSKIKNFFKALFRGLKLFFSKNSKVTIDEIFNDIQLGVYKNKVNFKNTDTKKIDSSLTRFRLGSKFKNPIDEREALEYLSYKFYQILNSLKVDNLKDASDPEIINQHGIHSIYSTLLLNIYADISDPKNAKKDGTARITEMFNILTENGDEQHIRWKEVDGHEYPEFVLPTRLLTIFNRHLKTDGVKISLDKVSPSKLTSHLGTTINPEQEDGESFNESWQQAHAEINPEERLSQRLKRKLNRLSKRTSTGKVQRNNFGAPIYYSGKEVFGFLGQNISDSYTIPEMMTKLRSIEKDKPFMKDLLELVVGDKSVQIDLFNTIGSKTYQVFKTVFEKDGEYILFDSNRKTIKSIIQDKLIGEFLNENNNLFEKYKRGNQRGKRDFTSPNSIKISKALKELKELKTISVNISGNKKGKTRQELIIDYLKELSKFLNKNHINITHTQLMDIWSPKRSDLDSRYKNIIDVVSAVEHIFNHLNNGDNPFLSNRPEKFNVGKGKRIEISAIQNLAQKLMPGLGKEYNDSFRNAENKTIYAIQLSNFLKKTFSEFKNPKKLKAYIDRISSDPVLSSMPLLKSFLDSENNPTQDLEEFEVTIFDALSRKGKNKSVDYKNLSDIEMTAVDLAMHFNNGTKEFGWYKLPIPSDSTTIPYVKGRKLSIEEIVDNLSEVALGEVKRIIKLKDSKKNSLLRLIPNYYNRGKRFQVLSFLNNAKVKTDGSTTKEEFKIAIEKYLNGKFLNKEIQEFKDKGVIESVKDGVIKFSPKVVTSVQGSRATDFFKEYLYNQFYMNTQMSTIFGGDPSFYKNTTDYQKRYKQIMSPGEYTNTQSKDVSPIYKGIILQDNFIPTNKETAENIKSLVNESDLPANKKKELIALWNAKSDTTPGAETNNETDAATFISVQRYLQILGSLGELTYAHKRAAVRITRQGIEKIEDIALFPPIKPFMYTKRYVDGTEVPTQIKNSETILTKSFADKHPKLKAIHKLFQEGDIDTVIFESAVKVGGIAHSLGKDGKPVFSKLEEIENGEYQLQESAPVIDFNHSDWKLQNRVPPHYVDDIGNFGTQIRQLIIADLDMDAYYGTGKNKKKGSEIAEEYQDLIIQNLKDSYFEVERMFLDDEGEIDYFKITRAIKKEMEARDLEQDYFDAIELVVNKDTGKTETTLPLWHPLITYKVETILNSIFKNNITKQKINGGNMVNATSFGVSDNLKFNVDKNGVIEMQAILPWSTRKYFPQNEDGSIDLTKIPKELKKIIGYRIPTEDKYSMFNITVVGFNSPASGGQIILPPEATTLAGLDFDIDKLFMMLPEFYINKKGEAVYIKPPAEHIEASEMADSIYRSYKLYTTFVKSNFEGKTKEKLLKHRREVAEAIMSNKNANELLNENEEYQKLLGDIELLKYQLEHVKKEDEKASLEKELDILIDNKLTFEVHDESQIVDEETVNKVKKYISDFIEKNDILPEEISSVESRNNRIIEIIQDIMENPNTTKSIIDPGSFDSLKQNANELRILSIPQKGNNIRTKGVKLIESFKKGKINVIEYRKQLAELAEELDSEDFNINLPSTQLELFRRNMTGIQLIGIFANHNTHHAKAQFTSLHTTTEVKFNGKKYTQLNKIKNENNERISKSLATMLAAVVDNAKDPIASFLNMNTFTADTIAFLSRLGVDSDTIFTFMTQPILKDVSTEYFKDKGSFVESTAVVNSMIAKQKTKLLSYDGFEKEDLKKLNYSASNLNLNDLQNSLVSKNTLDYDLQQFQVLVTFEKYLKTATELSAVVQASRVDTNAMGPTNGANYIVHNKQHKILTKKLPTIIGASEFLYETSDQKMNPAFNEYARIRPTSLMEKIFHSIGTRDTDGKIEYSIMGKIKNMLSDMKSDLFSLTDKEANQANTHFLTFLGSGLPFFNYKNSKDVLETLPERIINFKKQNPDSPYLLFLDNLKIKDADETTNIRSIQYYNTAKTSLDNEHIRRTWELMLLDNSSSEAKSIALDLVKYTYFSNGYAFSPFSFFHLIPTYFWTDAFAKLPGSQELGIVDKKERTFNQILKSAFEALEHSNLNSELIQRFMDQYMGNTVNRSFVIQEIKPTLQENFKVEDDLLILNKDLTTDYTLKNGKYTPYLKLAIPKSKEFRLFKIKMAKSNEVIYKEIPSLGTTNFLMEYNIHNDIDSSLITELSVVEEQKKTSPIDKTDMPSTKDLLGSLEGQPSASLSQLSSKPSVTDEVTEAAVRSIKEEESVSLGALTGKSESVPTYEEYKKRANELKTPIEDRITREEFEGASPELKTKHYKCL